MGRAPNGVCPCAGTCCSPWGWRRRHLPVGATGPSAGQGGGCGTWPSAPPALGCCSLRLAVSPAKGRVGGPVAAIATATRLGLKPSSQMSGVASGSICCCRDENFLPGCGNAAERFPLNVPRVWAARAQPRTAAAARGCRTEPRQALEWAGAGGQAGSPGPPAWPAGEGHCELVAVAPGWGGQGSPVELLMEGVRNPQLPAPSALTAGSGCRSNNREGFPWGRTQPSGLLCSPKYPLAWAWGSCCCPALSICPQPCPGWGQPGTTSGTW